MKRLLCIVGGMNTGGAETFLMKLYRQLDKSKYQMDFAVAIDGQGFYDEEINMLGGKIFKITPKSKGLLKNFFSIEKLVKKEKYKYVLRTSQNAMSALELLAARIGGAKICAFRSSNSDVAGGKKELFVHSLCKFMPKVFANVKIAPSTEAAEFMFGRKAVKNGKVILLHNALDLSRFYYDKDGGENIRAEYGLSKDSLLVGHIGRLEEQKNHKFLIETFNCLYKKNPNTILLLVGNGVLEESIRNKVNELGLRKNVIFAGVRSDIPNLLSAMDVFVFPSFYEGMPNTVIEAQACGLHCIISDSITKEADITGLVKFISLKDSAEQWANIVLNTATNHIDTKTAFVENKYDIVSAANQFTKLVFNEK